MCDGFSEAALIVGAVAAVGGTAVSYESGQAAAAASRTAQEQASEAQQTAFNQRMSAQQQELASQTAINTNAENTFSANQAATQDAETQDLNARQTQLTAINNQEQAIADQGNQAVQQGVQQASAPALAAAQANQAAEQQAMNTPGIEQAAATNPLGASDVGVTKDALDATTAGAGRLAQQYGDSLAKLSSYNAPLALAGQAATTIGTNLMPAAAADQLVKTSAPALLEPSTLAYQQAGQYGAAVNTANQMNTQGALGVASDAASNSADLANLQQSDANATIQGNLNVAQANDAAAAALGTGLSTLGNTAIQYGAATGGVKAVKAQIKAATS